MFYSFQSTDLFTSLARLFQGIIKVFAVIVNWINSLISLSAASLLLYRNATDFCMLICILWILNSFINSSGFFMESFGFSIYIGLYHVRTVKVLFLFCWFEWLISYCCLIAVAETSSAMLNNGGGNGNPCLIPDHRGKALNFFSHLGWYWL